MSDETIVAVFETSAQADDAISAIEAAGVPSNAIERHSNQSSREKGREPAPQGTGFFFWDMMFAAATPHQDRPDYERSIERGETIVAVTVSEQDADKVMAVLEESSPMDLSTRAAQAPESDIEEAPVRVDRPAVRRRQQETNAEEKEQDEEQRGRTENARATARSADRKAGPEETEEETEEEEVIPLGEERLEVGKRTVNRGTTRIRRYVVETPVEKPVTLRDERVTVERRRPAGESETGDALTEKTIEVTETSEVPVTEKVARLKEEAVVRRETAERTETVRDTVRRDQLAVEDASEQEDERPPRRRSNA